VKSDTCEAISGGMYPSIMYNPNIGQFEVYHSNQNIVESGYAYMTQPYQWEDFQIQ